MQVPTRYGQIKVTRHAIQRWQQRTGRSVWDLIGAVLNARRPTKNQLRRIQRKEGGWQPKRILECECAYFLVRNNHIVTVYDKQNAKERPMFNELSKPFISVHSRTALEREIEMAEALIESENTAFPDSSFEEGYIAALNFVMNRESSNVREEYEGMMSEQDGEAA